MAVLTGHSSSMCFCLRPWKRSLAPLISILLKSMFRLHTDYRTGLVCRVSNTLGKGPFALGKGFAECGTRQTALGKKSDGEGTFAECLFSGTRQSLCRVSKSTRQIFRNHIRKTAFKNSKTFYFHPVITPIIQCPKSQVSLLFRVKSRATWLP